jgi:hypothetical protein
MMPIGVSLLLNANPGLTGLAFFKAEFLSKARQLSIKYQKGLKFNPALF